MLRPRHGTPATSAVSGLMERATGFEPATFSLATAPWVMCHACSRVLRMAQNGHFEAVQAVFDFARNDALLPMKTPRFPHELAP